ncbi:MAG: TonB-dependent receptor plug domain-containing protein, partial [Gemmatimonadales bacterium]|nr:TonB-dependent receptor plug domain-containing protein [Gemmatimonadales bacterium]
ADAEVTAGDQRAVTAADGRATLGALAAGRLPLRVRRIGYAPWTDQVDAVPTQERALVVALIPLPVQLDPLVATASQGITISGDELSRRGTDLGRALDGWEGVVVRRTGSGGPAAPQIRGGSPDEVLVLVDGVALNDPLTGRADLSRIPARQVARVTLLPGAQTVRAGGRAIAGLLLVSTSGDTRPELASWVGSHGALGAQAGVTTGPLTALVSGERFAQDFPYSVPTVRGGGEAARRNAGGEAWSASLRYRTPIDVGVRAWLSRRGLPGTVTNPSPLAAAQDGSAVLTLRGSRLVDWSASATWVETRAADRAPASGAGYDSYTRGIGADLEVGRETGLRLGDWSGEGSLSVSARTDRFAGDGVQDGASFTQSSLRAGATLRRGRHSSWTLTPALRLDGWSGHASPRASARLDGGWQRGRTTISAALGSAVAPPALADLFFREGVGVRLNPDLRPERVRWEGELGVRRELGAGARGSLGLRLFAGRVADMVIWSPDFRFVWSPRNFDVVRRGGEISLDWRPAGPLRLDASATYAAVTYDTPGGAQVLYRPRTTAGAGISWSPGVWTADLRARRIGARFPNSAGTNPRPAITTLDAGLERRLGASLLARVEMRDIGDARAEFIAGYPTPGRSVFLTLTLRKP